MGRGVGVWRNRVNQVAGWLLGYGLFFFVSFLDPLSVYTPSQGTDGTQLDTELVSIHLFFATLSVIGFAIWAVPLVRTAPGVVRIVNPLTRWTLPAECLETLREGVMFPRLVCGEHVVRLWGLERSVLDSMRGHIVVPTTEPTTANTRGIEPSVKRSVHPALALLFALWLAVTAAGLL
ncbi:hypothetical protein ACOCJ7_14395 [Knoellia sp. CPCC 206453]|uniref:hypothetical protein n=1 Tax=Knoellia pratensis TaxID=3404796 RepID=UPI003B42BA33